MSTHTVTVPGALVTYDVHGDLAPGPTPLVMIGSLMDASGFATLRSRFHDRPVVTYDPRNTGRSTRDDPTAGVSPQEHAGDLHPVLADLAAGPVDLFASSGGAVNAVCDDMLATYDAHGLGPAMARFISFVMHRGPVPTDYLQRPAPDPAAFGLPVRDDGNRGAR